MRHCTHERYVEVNKIKRLETVHPNFSDRQPDFFQVKLENKKKETGTQWYEAGSKKTLVASFKTSKLITQSENDTQYDKLS